jgi:putative serine protease PepD
MQGEPENMNPRPAGTRLRRLAPLAVAAAIGVAAGAGAYALTNKHSNTTAAPNSVVVPAQPASSTSTSTDSLTQLYKQDAPGVVDITVTTTSGGGPSGFPFGAPQQGQKSQAEGTGFVIDTKGDIMTAEHVVAGASSIRVEFADGSTAKATLVGTPDKSTDTAVIHVDVPSSKLHPLALGNSSAVQPGQTVVAIGSPFGLAETMTAGIVSATNRTITAPNQFSITGAIQTDAAINHGNSGGPLIDVNTNTVVGVNDQIESDTNDNSGVGFAVPINSAKATAQTLIAGGTVQHAYVGVRIEDVPGGAKVTSIVAGAPAQKAGLKVGDVITSFNGKTIGSADDLTAAVFQAKPGQKVAVTVTRNGNTQHLSLTLGVQPAHPSS